MYSVFMAKQPLLGEVLLIIEDECSGRGKDLYQTANDTHTHTHNTEILAPGGIRNRNRSNRATADPRLRPRGHWDRQEKCVWN
jgi:hypothetical protein